MLLPSSVVMLFRLQTCKFARHGLALAVWDNLVTHCRRPDRAATDLQISNGPMSEQITLAVSEVIHRSLTSKPAEFISLDLLRLWHIAL